MMTNENESFLKETDDGGFAVDMTAVPAATNEVLPKATYNCTMDEIEYKLSQASGKPMWAMVFVIDDGEYEGRKLFSNMSFSDKALPYTKKTLAAIAPHLLTADFRPDKVDDYALAGQRYRVKTKIGKDESGEKRTEVANILPPAEGFNV